MLKWTAYFALMTIAFAFAKDSENGTMVEVADVFLKLFAALTILSALFVVFDPYKESRQERDEREYYEDFH
jgi:hypothetical protein